MHTTAVCLVIAAVLGSQTAKATEFEIDTYIRGRLVATLFDGIPTTDAEIVTWDGTDSNGRAVRDGTYFLQARTSSREQTRKIVWKK